MLRNLEKYLSKRAISGPWRLWPDPVSEDEGRFKGAIVIPSLAEGEELFATLDSIVENEQGSLTDTAIIVVINQRQEVSCEDKEINRSDLQRLKIFRDKNRLHTLYLVDVISDGLQLGPKDGVGLARKVGFDLALTLLDPEQNPVLISLDADTRVDSNYLSAIYNHFDCSTDLAAELPFFHRLPDHVQERQAIIIYELFLRLHVEGLLLAGSPYAYHTIGSAFACRAEAYIKAGGMKLRQGGEDFYFLQQIRKIGAIGRVEGTVVAPSARLSNRAPFGTGPALNRILKEGEGSWGFYPRHCYEILGSWLSLVERDSESAAESIIGNSMEISAELTEFLDRNGFAPFWQKCTNTHAARERRLRSFHDWFDGLKSLRLIHHLCAGSGRIDVARVLEEFDLDHDCNEENHLLDSLHHLQRQQGVLKR